MLCGDSVRPDMKKIIATTRYLTVYCCTYQSIFSFLAEVKLVKEPRRKSQAYGFDDATASTNVWEEVR